MTKEKKKAKLKENNEPRLLGRWRLLRGGGPRFRYLSEGGQPDFANLPKRASRHCQKLIIKKTERAQIRP